MGVVTRTDAKKKEMLALTLKGLQKVFILNEVNWKEKKKIECSNETRQKSKGEIIVEFHFKGISLPRKRQLKRDKVLKIASSHNISTFYEVGKNSLENWIGKPKGPTDVFYQQGILDLDTFYFNNFNEKGQKYSCGQIIEGTNLYGMLGSCTDFTKKYTLIKNNCKSMGAKCDRSPKYHREVAGEGIEYSWGNAKMVFRIIRMKNRKSVSDLRPKMKRVLSKEVP